MSVLEDEMAFQLRAAGLPTPEREVRTVFARQFRSDFAWPDPAGGGIALEIEGGTWTGGRHVTGTGYEQDCTKYSLMAVQGWVVIRATAGMVRSGMALALVEQAFARKGAT